MILSFPFFIAILLPNFKTNIVSSFVRVISLVLSFHFTVIPTDSAAARTGIRVLLLASIKGLPISSENATFLPFIDRDKPAGFVTSVVTAVG
ncbi:hypothetical protein D3C73_1043420 [compost metagenome]